MSLSADDKIAIQELSSRLCEAWDAGDGAAFSATFTESGSIKIGQGGPVMGREELEAMVPVPPSAGSRHYTSDHIVVWDGDVVIHDCQFFVTKIEDGEVSIVRTAHHHALVQKTGGHWLFEHIEVTPDI